MVVVQRGKKSQLIRKTVYKLERGLGSSNWSSMMNKLTVSSVDETVVIEFYPENSTYSVVRPVSGVVIPMLVTPFPGIATQAAISQSDFDEVKLTEFLKATIGPSVFENAVKMTA